MTERTLSSAPQDQASDAPPPADRRRRGLVLAVLLTCQLMLVLDVTVMNVALPRIQTDLHFSATGLVWVINAYTLVYGGLLLLGGRAGDQYGRRRLFIAGLALFTLASLAGGLATSGAWLLAARVVQGLGAAAAGPSVLALITTTFTEPRARVRALALFTAMSSSGFALGLIVGGVLTELTSWRSVLFINVPIGIAVTVLAVAILHEPVRNPGRLDLPGAVTSTAGVAALGYGFIRAASAGWTDPLTIGSLAGGLVLMAGFLLIETRARQPLMPLYLFAHRDRAAAYANYLLGPMALLSMFFFLSQFLQEVLHLSPLATGFAFLPMAGLLFVVSRLMPTLLPRLGPKTISITGSVLIIIGLLWLTRLGPTSGYPSALLGPLVLMGLGGGLAFAPLSIVIMSSVPPKDAGAAGGVLQTVQNFGASLGLAVLATVYGTASRHAIAHGAAPRPAMVTGMTSAFATAAVFAMAALLVALTFRRQQAPAPAPALAPAARRD